jgi:hypothetical protein
MEGIEQRKINTIIKNALGDTAKNDINEEERCEEER